MVVSSRTVYESHSSSHTTGAATSATTAFIEATATEKQNLQRLNERLSVYIDKVKKLEETNRILVEELDKLRATFGAAVSEVKVKFTESLKSTRTQIDHAAGETIGIEVRVQRLREDLADYRNRYEEVRREVERERTHWGGAIAGAQQELERQKSMYHSILEEEKRLYAEQEHIYADLDAAKDDLDKAIHGRLDFERQEKNLQAELDFLHRVHTQEITELRALLAQAPADTRDIFRNELALAIREIKAEYENLITTNTASMRQYYEQRVKQVSSTLEGRKIESVSRSVEVTKMQESMASLHARFSKLEQENRLLEEEARKLEMQLRADQSSYEAELAKRDSTLRYMREDCQILVAELQALLNTKQTLDAEIAIYRELLTGEEHRLGTVVTAVRHVEQARSSDGYGEFNLRATFTRHATGNISILECEPTGAYITLENTLAYGDEDVGGAQIVRTIDGHRAFSYTIPHGTRIHAGHHLKIWSRNAGGHHGHDSIVADLDSWGQGVTVVTSFLVHGVEKATHTQKTTRG